MQHHLVTVKAQGKQPPVYRVDTGHVLLRVQFPRWIHVAKAMFGDAGELIVEDTLQQGRALVAQVCGTLQCNTWETH